MTGPKRRRTNANAPNDQSPANAGIRPSGRLPLLLWIVGDDISHGLRTVVVSPLRTAAPYGPSAHRMGDCAGRSPGSRVVAWSSSLPSFPVADADDRLAAYSCGGSHGLRLKPQPCPCSLLPPRREPGNQRGDSISCKALAVKPTRDDDRTSVAAKPHLDLGLTSNTTDRTWP